MLMYAKAGKVDSMTFPLVFQYYYAGTTNAHKRVSRRPRDPPRIMDVLRDAQWRTNTLSVLSARQLVHVTRRRPGAHRGCH